MTSAFIYPIPVERLRARLSYCPETGLLHWKERAGGRSAGARAGSIDREGYIALGFDGHKLRGHRVAWAIHYGTWPDQEIDHVNRNKADNSIRNLRLATDSQNSANRGLMRFNSHGSKGVTCLPSGSWQAQIQVNKKNHYLGAFKDKADAIAAYAAAAVRFFGTYASLEIKP